jgi:hypothetical protein
MNVRGGGGRSFLAQMEILLLTYKNNTMKYSINQQFFKDFLEYLLHSVAGAIQGKITVIIGIPGGNFVLPFCLK